MSLYFPLDVSLTGIALRPPITSEEARSQKTLELLTEPAMQLGDLGLLAEQLGHVRSGVGIGHQRRHLGRREAEAGLEQAMKVARILEAARTARRGSPRHRPPRSPAGRRNAWRHRDRGPRDRNVIEKQDHQIVSCGSWTTTGGYQGSERRSRSRRRHTGLVSAQGGFPLRQVARLVTAGRGFPRPHLEFEAGCPCLALAASASGRTRVSRIVL